jgi:hypothetical protein
MNLKVIPIPNGHAMRWRAAYAVVDLDKTGVMHIDLGWTCAWVDTIEQGNAKIEELELAAAHKIMVAGTKAEHA